MVENALSGVSQLSIIKHEKLDEGVYSTLYEDGTQIIVNYNDNDVLYKG